jgi:predicted Zn-dependent protease
MKITTVLGLVPALLLAACTTASFGHRDRECSVDQRLDALLDEYDHARSGEDESSRLLVDCDRIRNEIDRLALEFPSHPRTLLACAQLSYDAREVERSQSYLDQLFRAQTASPEGGVLRSRIAAEEGNLQLARRVLETQIQYTPDHPLLREALSSVMYLSGDLAGARAAIAAAESLGAPVWRIAYHRGLIAEAAGDNGEARRQFQACLDANPEYPQARSRLSGMKAAGG